MAEQLTPISTLANNNVTTLVALANSIVNTMATTMVTANGASNGALTTGNGYVSGIFGAATLIGTFLRGGSVQASGNLTITSNTFVNSSSFSVGNTTSNVSMSATGLLTPNAQITVANIGSFNQSQLAFANTKITDVALTWSGTTATTIDSFSLAAIRSAEYLIQLRDNTANNNQLSKLLVIHDGTNPLFTEFGLLTTNNAVATLSVTANSTAVLLQATSTNANTSVRLVRTSLNL